MLLNVLARHRRPNTVISPTSETSVTAEVKSDNATGSSLVQIVLPLPPGLVTDQMVTDRKITLLVNGVEQAVFMKAARGRHPNGFLGNNGSEWVSMVQGHFTYNIPDTTNAISAEFIINRVRSVSDITETTITDTHITNRRACYPTSATYLCSTWLTFWPLLPVASMNANNTAFFSTLFDTQYEVFKNTEIDSGTYSTATYEWVRSLFAMWCMTGTRKYFWNAYRRSRGLLNYTLPDSASHWSPEINPGALTTGISGSGLPNEQHSQRYMGLGVGYRVTGLIEQWNVICANHAWGSWANTSQSATATLNDNNAISGNYNNRFNLRTRASSILAFLIDTTRVFSNSNGGWTGRQPSATEFQWILDAYATNDYDLVDFRDGMQGNADTATVDGTATAGESPTFQWALTTCWLLDCYLNLKADSAIAAVIKIHVDAMLSTLTATGSGNPGFGQGAAYGYKYLLTSTSASSPDAEDPWTIVMWAAPVKFVEKVYGNNTVNGATYSTWYIRLTDPGQVSTNHLTWSTKIFGETFGYNMHAAYLDQVGIPTGLNSTIRTPTQY